MEVIVVVFAALLSVLMLAVVWSVCELASLGGEMGRLRRDMAILSAVVKTYMQLELDELEELDKKDRGIVTGEMPENVKAALAKTFEKHGV